MIYHVYLVLPVVILASVAGTRSSLGREANHEEANNTFLRNGRSSNGVRIGRQKR